MTFITNQTNTMIKNYIDGTLYAHPHLQKHDMLPLIYDKTFDGSTIPILSGGGSGHEPAHLGFIGKGMLTAAIYGPLFYPPSSEDILQSIQFLDRGQGVFVIVKNFEADLTHFQKAIYQARLNGHHVKYVVSHDDISVEPKKHFQLRGRGLAGTILLHKIIGAAAQNGYDLKQLETLGLNIATQTATIGFATKSATLPNAALPLFDLDRNHISYGIGIHGEQGYRTVPFKTSEHLAIEIVNKLKLNFHWQENDHFILLVNNLGTTTDMEMGIFINDVCQLLSIDKLQLPYIKSGKFMTSLDMTGISVTLCKITDNQWIQLLNEPTTAFAW